MPLRLRLSYISFVLLASSPLIHAQATSPPSQADPNQLSPQAAYVGALHPLESTRANIANWSDLEIAAMKISIARAKTACDARADTAYAGSDLLDFARLCALGQEWPVVADAAGRYLAEPNTEKPRLTEAFATRVGAELRMKAENAALVDSQTMLSVVPYTAAVGSSTDETLAYMRFVHTTDALALATQRQPLILDRLRTPLDSGPVSETAKNAEHPTATPTAAPPPPTHVLYAEGLELAMLQQLSGHPEAAQPTRAALDAALPPNLRADEALPVAASRRQYDLLGQPLPKIAAKASLQTVSGKLPFIPAHHTITGLLLFPDWCAACLRLGPKLPETVVSVEGHGAYLYALLAETVPPRMPPPSRTSPDPAFAAAALAGTPTVTVPAKTLDLFGADDFPCFILLDANGILRVLQTVAEEDLAPGGVIDAAIALVGRTFPPTIPAPAPQPPKSNSALRTKVQ